MKRNVFLLATCQALLMTGGVLLISTAALAAVQLAGTTELATLPVALFFLATMLTVIPASFAMGRIGRRLGFVLGALIGTIGATLATLAIFMGSFALFCAGVGMVGVFNGFGNYYRFAAADVATEEYRSRAISYVLAGGVIAAFAGPNLANWTHQLVVGKEFSGTYLALAVICGAALLASAPLRVPRPPSQVRFTSGRAMAVIGRQPAFVVALLGAMLGYAVMILLMTAAPLAMKEQAYPFEQSSFVIQWHVFGMFAPAFFTGGLIRRFGVLEVMLAGGLMGAASIGISLASSSVLAFWLALLFLGVSWNFLFTGGTTLLTETYRPEEKTKTQALNDFAVFTTVAAAALSAGLLLGTVGWRGLNLAVAPAIALALAAVSWLRWRRASEPG